MFCAVAVSGASTVLPLKPRKQSRLSSRMRFMSPKRISIFSRCLRARCRGGIVCYRCSTIVIYVAEEDPAVQGGIFSILSAVNKSMSGRNVRPVRYILEAGDFGGRGSKKHAGDGSMVSYSARFQEV
jgi:hypothetical protein